jgi:hypothetical protein
MADITLKIPLELTKSLIIRRLAIVYGNDVDISCARELAEELHAIVGAYLNLHSVRPPDGYPEPDEEFTKADMLFAILRTALDWWPKEGDATAHESVWIMDQFKRVDGDELYERYLRLSDRINNTDFANLGRR